MEVLAEVPRGRLEVLHLLLDLFVAISNNYKVNKMKPSNMAMVCFFSSSFPRNFVGWLPSASVYSLPSIPFFP